MWNGTTRHAWIRHLLVAALYAVGYVLLRSVSVSNWNLPAGLRLVCLLLVPYRYWPALIVGEAIPVGYQALDCQHLFGWTWTALAAVPPMLINAPAAAWFRRHTSLQREDGQTDMGLLLALALVCSGITAAGNSLALASAVSPTGQAMPAVTLQIVFIYILGNYIGALTLTPAVLAVRAWLHDRRHATARHPLEQVALLRDGMVGLLPSVLLLSWIGYASQSDDTMQVCRVAMFLPVAWLALRHGWQGAATGGALVSAVIALTSTMLRDPAVIQAHAIIGFAITTLLMFGSRMAHQAADAEQRDHLVREHSLLLAQEGLYQEEQRLRQAAEALEHVGQSMRDMQNRLLERLRHILPANEERAYSRQAALAQHEMHRLSNALFPRAWRERGVPANLQDGPLAHAVSLAGASYQCELSGKGLDLLAPDVHMTLYRLASESLVYALARQPTWNVRLRVRGGFTHGQRWAVMRMDCERTLVADANTPPAADSWSKAMSMLGASGLDIETIRERAQIYGGEVHLRESETGLRITMLLHDALRTTRVMAGGRS
jgi:glucose-6-phosphate-specific signal transduction histidine kinase